MVKKLTILVATSNPGKMLEVKDLFDEVTHCKFRLITPDEAGITLDVKEDGQTYRENASKKAQAYGRASGLIALADDSGLEVDALDGRPGLYSARYTGSNSADALSASMTIRKLSDAARRVALLEELKTCPRPWKARFCCAVAAAFPDGPTHITEGVCTGEIVPDERGTSGFGYDPIFQLDDPAYGGLTMAELSLEQKNRISHRAIAVRQAIELLEKRMDN